MEYSELESCLAKYPHGYVGRYPHRYKVYTHTQSTAGLFSWLKAEGFFAFHVTNTRAEIISAHQVVAFFCCGGKIAFRNGFTCRKDQDEVHHLDGDTTNNNPSNLVYVPSECHAMVTKHQKVLIRKLRKFKKGDILKLQDVQCWSRKGRLIQRTLDHILMLLLKTMITSAKRVGVKVKRHQFRCWVARILRRIQFDVDSSFVSAFILEQWA